jgi:hypothetical protein
MMSEKTQTPTQPADRWNDLAASVTNARQDFVEVSLTGFEQTVDAILAHERKLAEAIPVDWLREAMVVRAAVLDEAKTAYLRFARSLVHAGVPSR